MTIHYGSLLEIAIAQARIGLAEGGIPIGAALFSGDGRLLGEGRNRRIQEEDPSAHAETNAFRLAGRQRSYRDTIMVTTLAPCFYCSGLIRQFNIPTVVYGESRTFAGGLAWLAEAGVQLFDQDSDECAQMMTTFIATRPDVWFEDIGAEPQ